MSGDGRSARRRPARAWSGRSRRRARSRAGPGRCHRAVAAASAPTLSRPIGGLAGGKDNAGIQDSEWVEAAASPGGRGPRSPRHRPVRAGPARSRPSPCSPAGVPPSADTAPRHLVEQLGDGRLPARPCRFGQQVHVHVPVAGVAEDHRRDAARSRRPAAPQRMYSPSALHRARSRPRPPAAIAGAPEARPGSDSRRDAAPRAALAAVGLSAVVHRCGDRPHRLGRGDPPPGQLGGIRALQLDQQDGLGSRAETFALDGPAPPARGRCGRAARMADGSAPCSAATTLRPGRRASAARPGAPARMARDRVQRAIRPR